MSTIKNIVLNLNSLKTGQKTSFKIGPKTTLCLKIIGSFNNKHLYQQLFNILLAGKESALNLQGKFFICDDSQLKLQFVVKDTKKTKAAKINLDLRGLVFDKNSHALIEQNISLSHKDSLLHHSLAFGSLSPEILNYLSSRGVEKTWLRNYLFSNYATI